MKKTIAIIAILILSLLLLFSISCTRIIDGPNNYPNTRWVSEDPEMFFVMGGEQSWTRAIYGQLSKNGETIECLVRIYEFGGTIWFDDLSFYDSETGRLLEGENTGDAILFSGVYWLYEDRLILTDIRDKKDFFPDSITEIVFYREDLTKEEVQYYYDISFFGRNEFNSRIS